MATWLRRAISTQSNMINLVSSGTKLYYFGSGSQSHRPLVDVGADIYEFDLATLTEAKVIDVSNAGLAGCGAIAWFKGNLYLIDQMIDTSGSPTIHITIKVYRWTGVTDGITLVDTLYDETFTGSYGGAGVLRLYADDNYIISLAANDLASANTINHSNYSTDGSSWNTGTLPFSVLGTTTNGRYSWGADFSQGIYDMLYNNTLAKWEGVVATSGEFAVHQATLPSGGLFYSDPASGGIHWSTFGGFYEVLSHDMSTRSPGDPGYEIQAYIQIGLPYSIGMKFITGGMELYTTNTGSWSLLEQVTESPFNPVLYPETTWVILADDGELYIIGFNDTTNDFEVWKRSEPLIPPPPTPDTGGPAILYWGSNTSEHSKVLVI